MVLVPQHSLTETYSIAVLLQYAWGMGLQKDRELEVNSFITRLSYIEISDI